jgi:hypothetical protein
MNVSQSLSSASTPAPQSACYDPLDIDSFINFDPIVYPPAVSNPNNTLLPLSMSGNDGNLQQTFSGPSHQYDNYKQQTGIPAGSLASLVANQGPLTPFGRLQSNLSTSDDGYFTGLGMGEEEFIDFGSTPFAGDVDMDFDSSEQDSISGFFYGESPASSSTGFIDPSAISSQNDQPTVKHDATTTNTVNRLYPGVHQQQAALALAKAQEQKQQQAHRRQHLTVPQQPQNSRRSSKASPTNQGDPLVQEKISQLLKSMRQSSVTSTEDDAESSTAVGILPNVSRSRKEEEDMDEDERLLASEEGKKLSSKERRQLRNKVSARAFRSRRKEYIGQLEAELAAKTAEANEYKSRVANLEQENSRLTDLTKMLLSSPAFSHFMDNLSSAGSSTPASTRSVEQPRTEASRQNQNVSMTRKDVNPYAASQRQAQQQANPQVGLALVPEHQVDFSAMDLNTTWPVGSMGNNSWTTNQQVFAVIEIPAGPPVDQQIDIGILSGKSQNSLLSQSQKEEFKQDTPSTRRLPSISQDTRSNADSKPPISLHPSDPEYSILWDGSSSEKGSPKPFESACAFNGLKSEKSFLLVEISSINIDIEISTDVMESFRRTCDSLEAAFERIEGLIPLL